MRETTAIFFKKFLKNLNLLPKEIKAENEKIRKIGETESVPRIVKSDLDEEIKDSNVLLVDDIADSGRTLKVALEHVYTFKPKSVRVLTLFKKSRSIITPDYFHEVIDKWVVFPWEIRETISEIRDRKILKKLNFDDCYLNKYLSY